MWGWYVGSDDYPVFLQRVEHGPTSPATQRQPAVPFRWYRVSEITTGSELDYETINDAAKDITTQVA